MKKFIIFVLLALMLVSAQCFVTVTADVPSLVYSDSFINNQGWNQQYAGEFTAFIDNEDLRMTITSNVDEGALYVPLSNWNSLSDTYSIQVDARVGNTGDATALILFNYIDNQNHDTFQIDQSGDWRLVRFTDGNVAYNSLWNNDFELDSAGYANTIIISQHEDRIDLNFNGASSESIYLPSRGQTVAVELGLRGDNGGTVWYDNLYLTRLTY